MTKYVYLFKDGNASRRNLLACDKAELKQGNQNK